MRTLSLTLAAFSMLVVAAPAQAQEAEEAPEVRIMTISAFYVPFGPEMAEFMKFADEYLVPSSSSDPHILMYRIATHYWGTTDVTVWLITEYASLAEMEQSSSWQNEWYEEHYPEGTPEREAADAAFNDVFLPYFAHHEDQILTVNMKRTK